MAKRILFMLTTAILLTTVAYSGPSPGHSRHAVYVNTDASLAPVIIADFPVVQATDIYVAVQPANLDPNAEIKSVRNVYPAIGDAKRDLPIKPTIKMKWRSFHLRE